jgi:hypothetical protein
MQLKMVISYYSSYYSVPVSTSAQETLFLASALLCSITRNGYALKAAIEYSRLNIIKILLAKKVVTTNIPAIFGKWEEAITLVLKYHALYYNRHIAIADYLKWFKEANN